MMTYSHGIWGLECTQGAVSAIAEIKPLFKSNKAPINKNLFISYPHFIFLILSKNLDLVNLNSRSTAIQIVRKLFSQAITAIDIFAIHIIRTIACVIHLWCIISTISNLTCLPWRVIPRSTLTWLSTITHRATTITNIYDLKYYLFLITNYILNDQSYLDIDNGIPY